MRTTAYKTAALPSLILIGIGIFVISGRWDLITRLEVFGTAGGMVCGALAGRHIWRMSDWLDGLGRRGRVLTVLILATVLPLQMMIIALATGRLLVPQIHDEQMYLLQARQLAAFHLAMPALPLGEFFDTFYVLVKPVYASMYFPGTALAYVPAVWMHLPFWVWPVLVMTGMLVMTYLVAARIFGRLVALITVFLMLGAPVMSSMPTETLSHPLGALLGLSIVYGWLRWRKKPMVRWAVVIGTAAGWMAVTRPMESFCFTIPVLLAIGLAAGRDNWRQTLRHGTIAAACALPFVALQLLDNYAITGSVTRLPITLYVQQEFPGVTTFGSDPLDMRSESPLRQKQDMFRTFVRPQRHLNMYLSPLTLWRMRFSFILATALACPLMFPLIPLSMLLLARTEIRVLWCAVALFFAIYVAYPGYVDHYTIQINGILTMLLVAGALHLSSYKGTPKWIPPGLLGGLTGSATAAVIALHFGPTAAAKDADVMQFNYVSLPKIVEKPALVLFRYGPESSPHTEPVYNLEAAWPDDCAIVRAHDLGPQKDHELFRYFASIPQDRTVYRFDRDARTLQKIGHISELEK